MSDSELPPAALACRALVPFLAAAAVDVRRNCDPLDADLLEMAARDCADTIEWEFDMLQVAERALVRSRGHAGWTALCDDLDGEAVSDAPFAEALELYRPVALEAQQASAHAPDTLTDAELDRLRDVARAHEQRLMTIARLRDLWFGTEVEERERLQSETKVE